MEQNEQVYNCATPSCSNTIRFTTEDEERFRKMKFVDSSGNVTKPRYCRKCKEERRANQDRR